MTIVDTKRDLLLALEKTTKQNDTQNVITEETYQRNILKINVDAIDKKIELIKGEGLEEQKLRAELANKRQDEIIATNTKIQEIHNREFTERQTNLKNQLDENIAAIKEADAVVQADPNKNFTDKAQSKLDSDNKALELYRTYNVKVDEMEKQLIQQTTRNSREIVKAQQQTSIQVISDRKEVEIARLTDIQREGDAEIVQENIKYETIRKSILDNEKLTVEEKNRLIEQLSSANNITILTKELETLEQQFTHKTLMYAQDQIREEEYLKAKNDRLKKAGDLEAAIISANNKKRNDAINNKPTTVEGLIGERIAGALGYDKDSPQGKIIGKETAQAFSLANDAMHSYYDAERQRIQDSLALNLQRLDLEEQQVKARAQSQAELDSIDKQYAAKKKAAQKEAGEEIKKSKRAELKIALVTEIANDAVAAAAFPFPFNLGIFAVMAGLAYGRYSLGLGQINAQQFAYGGSPDMTTTRGGRVKGRPHSQGGNPFMFKGRVFEDEIEELNIIRTKNTPRNKIFQAIGTQSQISSLMNVVGGGRPFEPGRKLKKFDMGGTLGATLQAPQFIPSSSYNTINNNNGNKELLEEVKQLRQDQQRCASEISKWQKSLEVVQVTSSLTKAQRKEVQQKSIGTL